MGMNQLKWQRAIYNHQDCVSIAISIANKPKNGLGRDPQDLEQV